MERKRARMVRRQLRDRGIADVRVLEAMAAIPREEFVDPALRHAAYADRALPIGHEQTLSQPWVVAAICAALELTGSESVLEIGTGSGYSTAVLARLGRRVQTYEILEPLAHAAEERLARLGIANVEVVSGDGAAAGTGAERFEAIAVHAVAPELPAALAARLSPGGRLVIPIAAGEADMLTLFHSAAATATATAPGDLERREIAPCRFVPLLGEAGYPGPAR